MAECELRQRKKEEDGGVKLQEDNDEIKSTIEQDQVQSDIKLEPVRFIPNSLYLGTVFLYFVNFPYFV